MRKDVGTTLSINTPEILTAAGTALSENDDRKSWHIQNLGTNPIFVRIGGTASTTVFHLILKGGTAQDDGSGGFYGEDGNIVTGALISVAGTSPRYVVKEQ